MKHIVRVFAGFASIALLAPPSSAQTSTGQIAARQGPAPLSIDVQGGKLHYFVLNQDAAGIPLVAINGGPGFDHSYMLESPVWAGLARKRPVIFYDQRGTGLSTSNVPASSQTIRMLVEDLEALRRHLGVEKFTLLGHSWGGILALSYALAYPGHVSKLILVGSGSPNPATHEFLFDKLFPEIIARQKPDSSPAGKVGCSDVGDYERMSYYDLRNRPRSGGDGGFSSEVCTAVMLQALKLDLFPQLKGLRVPTLVTNGRFDANVAPTVAYKISKAIPGSELVYFERSGHSPFVEEPEKFELVVGNFLNDAGPRTPQKSTGDRP